MNNGVRNFGLIAAAAGLAVTLCGCISDPTTNATPISAAMAAAVAAPSPQPTFAGVPAAPTDLRKPVEWRAAVGAEEQMRLQILRDSAPETFALKGDTEAFAERSRNEATNLAPAVPTAADRANTEAYAASLRGQASPPSATPR